MAAHPHSGDHPHQCHIHARRSQRRKPSECRRCCKFISLAKLCMYMWSNLISIVPMYMGRSLTERCIPQSLLSTYYKLIALVMMNGTLCSHHLHSRNLHVNIRTCYWGVCQFGGVPVLISLILTMVLKL